MSNFNLSSLIRENVKQLKPYSSARDEFTGIASVYLDANENPFNSDYNRYPDPHQLALKKDIAAIKNVRPDQILLGNGSDEPIDLLFRAFCEPGHDNVLIPQPTYGMYSVSAAINNVAIRAVNLTADFDLDEESIAAAWDSNTKIIFLCSPNNPSGNLLNSSKVIALLSRFSGLIVIDEAYIDFTETPGFLPQLEKFKNLVVLQTFSKAWGLAGIRLGMCFASPEILHALNKIKPPYNISSLTQSVATQALKNEGKKKSWVLAIKKERDHLRGQLERLPIIKKVYPSDANFLLVRLTNARTIYERLVTLGIIVRDRSSVVLCADCLRITVGTELENKTLIDALALL